MVIRLILYKIILDFEVRKPLTSTVRLKTTVTEGGEGGGGGIGPTF